MTIERNCLFSFASHNKLVAFLGLAVAGIGIYLGRWLITRVRTDNGTTKQTHDLASKTFSHKTKPNPNQQGSISQPIDILRENLIKNKIEEVKNIISSHSLNLQDPEIQEICIYNCSSIEMAQYLITAGLNIKSIDKKAPRVIGCVLKDNLDLLEFYAKQGLENLFQMSIEYTPLSIELIGAYGTDKNTLDGYLDYPIITGLLHRFVLATVEQSSWSIDSINMCLSFYCKMGDEEGVKSLMDTIWQLDLQNHVDIKELIRNSLLLGHAKILETLFSFSPLSNFTEDEQKALFSEACAYGYIEIQQLLKEKGCVCSEENRLQSISQKNWFEEGEAERQFPALLHYKTYSRCLNKDHLKLYGEKISQVRYQEEQTKSLKFALWSMKENEKTSDKVASFHRLLTALGVKRQHTAFILHSKNSDAFGSRRHRTMSVPTKGPYAHYRDRLISNARTEITVDGKLYTLKKNDSLLDAPEHSYNKFWQENDPLFLYTANCYNKGLLKDAEELKETISDFHWLLANNPPFYRGTAAIAETITDAMWIYHAHTPPQPLEAGKSLDLEALCTRRMEDFRTLYPMGKKI